MDLILVTAFFLSIAIVFIGLALLVGGGWDEFIMNLLTQTYPTQEYIASQKMIKPTKTKTGKLLGLGLMILGLTILIIIFKYSFT